MHGSRGRDDERRRSQQHDSEQEPLAPEAITQGGCERRDRGRREQAHEAGDPDRRGSAVAVREHTEGDEVRPLGGHRRAPGQLGPANVDVPSRDAKGGERLAQTGHEESQPHGDSFHEEVRGAPVPSRAPASGRRWLNDQPTKHLQGRLGRRAAAARWDRGNCGT